MVRASPAVQRIYESGREGRDDVDAVGPGPELPASLSDENMLKKFPEHMRPGMKYIVARWLGAGKILPLAYMGSQAFTTAMKDKAVENANVIKDGHEFDAVDPMALEKIAAMTIHEATDLLPHAARACCGPVLEALIARGADLDAFSFERGNLSSGIVPLHIVAKVARPRVLAVMLAGGGDANATDAWGWTALHFVCHNATIARSVEKVMREWGVTREQAVSIHTGAAGDALESVRALLDGGADPTLQTAKQAQATEHRYAERRFPYDLLVDSNGAPATNETCRAMRSLLLEAIATRGGPPSAEAQAAAAARQRAAHRATVAEADRLGGDSATRAGYSSDLQTQAPAMKHIVAGEDAAQEKLKAVAKLSGKNRVCDYCGRGSQRKLSRCGKCKWVFYCNASCQRRAWPAHKKACGKAVERLCEAVRDLHGPVEVHQSAQRAQQNEADDARAEEVN